MNAKLHEKSEEDIRDYGIMITRETNHEKSYYVDGDAYINM